VLQKSILFNLLVMFGISIALLILFFGSLNWLTNHGRQVTVPNTFGMKMDKAIDILEDMGFRVEVDSTYKAGRKPLEVLFQEPESGMSVKYGRTVFLTINRQTPPSIPMPNLVNMSFRNALLTLHSYYLEVGDTLYRPDVAAGAVLEQRRNGKTIVPGTQVPFGTRIDLVVGEGLSGEIEVPNLVGMTWENTRALLDSLQLTANPIWEGSISDSNTAIVYMQVPESLNELDFKNSILQGDIIDVRLMQNPSPELLAENQPGSKRLTGDTSETTMPVPTSSPAPNPTGMRKTDTAQRMRPLPGTFIHNASANPKTVDPKKKNEVPVNTNAPHTDVNKTPKPKPAETKKPTAPKTDKKPEPFSTDYN